MSAWDSGTVRSVPQGLERSDRSTRAPHNAAGRLDLLEAQRRFAKFLREFRIEHEFIYRYVEGTGLWNHMNLSGHVISTTDYRHVIHMLSICLYIFITEIL